MCNKSNHTHYIKFTGGTHEISLNPYTHEIIIPSHLHTVETPDCHLCKGHGHIFGYPCDCMFFSEEDKQRYYESLKDHPWFSDSNK